MSCACCKIHQVSVCVRCISSNVNKFHERVTAFAKSNQQKAAAVTLHLKNRLPSSKEIQISLHNVRRETAYTRDLVTTQQKHLDELRDRVARRRQMLEEARQTLHTTSTETINTLKTRNKARRKAWKSTYEQTVVERRQIVRECISIYRLRPLSYRRQVHIPDPCFFEIGGLSLPSLFCLREYALWHVAQVMSNLAHLTFHLARYLGVVLPHEIHLPTAAALHVTIQAGDVLTPLVGIETDYKPLATALACLAIDIQHLCRTQGSFLPGSVEDDLGRLLFAILASPTLGQHSTDIAFSTSQDKDKAIKERRVDNWDMSVLADKIYDDLTTDPFEIIENHAGQSTMAHSNYQFVM